MSKVITVATTLRSALGGVTFKVERNDVNTQLHSYHVNGVEKVDGRNNIVIVRIYNIWKKQRAPDRIHTHLRAYANPHGHRKYHTYTRNINPVLARLIRLQRDQKQCCACVCGTICRHRNHFHLLYADRFNQLSRIIAPSVKLIFFLITNNTVYNIYA